MYQFIHLLTEAYPGCLSQKSHTHNSGPSSASRPRFQAVPHGGSLRSVALGNYESRLARANSPRAKRITAAPKKDGPPTQYQ